MSNDMSTTPSTSENHRWIIIFANQDGRDSGSETQADHAYFQQCLVQLEKMLMPGLEIRSIPQAPNIVFICGPDNLCLQLKNQVEADNWAQMGRDLPLYKFPEPGQ